MEHWPFRPIMIGLILIAMPIGIVHRLRARTDETISHEPEGWLMFWSLRVAGVALWGGVLAYMIDPRTLAWSFLDLPRPARWVGVAMGALGVPYLLWVFRHLGHNVTDTVVSRRNATLVTTGPYRWVRHPLYTMILGNSIGLTLLTSSWFLGVGSLLAFVLLTIRTREEERRLIAAFGDDYRAYMARTGRYLPRLLPAR